MSKRLKKGDLAQIKNPGNSANLCYEAYLCEKYYFNFRQERSVDEGFVNTLEESVEEKCTKSKHIE